MSQHFGAASPARGDDFVGRQSELQSLYDLLVVRRERVVGVTGPAGVGKTSLAKLFAGRYEASFPGGVIFQQGTTRAVRNRELALSLAADFNREALLIVDEVDRVPTAQGEMAALRAQFPLLQCLLVGRETPTAQTIRLRGLSKAELGELISRVLGPKSAIGAGVLAQYGDYPASVAAVLSALNERVLQAEDVGVALSPFRRSGLLGPDGKPIEATSATGAALIDLGAKANEELLAHVRRNPSTLYQVTPRRFEELLAHVLHREGFTVTLTPATRDGGKDIYAAKRDNLGSFLYVVEAKRYSPTDSVGVHFVRALYGVVQHERATAGILVTTSHFTRDAHKFQETVEHQLSLRDYAALVGWLSQLN